MVKDIIMRKNASLQKLQYVYFVAGDINVGSTPSSVGINARIGDILPGSAFPIDSSLKRAKQTMSVDIGVRHLFFDSGFQGSSHLATEVVDNTYHVDSGH